MTQCPFCSAPNVANSVFCNQCGAYLLEVDTPETNRLNVDKIGWVGEETSAPEAALSPQPSTGPMAVRLTIGSEKRQAKFTLDKIIRIGRLDPASNVFPELDLTHDGPTAKAISRRHAVILKQEDKVIVEDVDSVNGTFINGKKLKPYVPAELKDGDTLQLGTLLVMVEIIS